MNHHSFSFDEPLDANIDLTPLIDTVFMLLVFFIMATTFSKPVLEVALQNAEGGAVQEVKQEPLTITITEEGKLFLEQKEVTLETVEATIAEIQNEQGIIFNVDKQAPFGLFVQTLDMAKKHGKENIAINTAGAEK